MTIEYDRACLEGEFMKSRAPFRLQHPVSVADLNGETVDEVRSRLYPGWHVLPYVTGGDAEKGPRPHYTVRPQTERDRNLASPHFDVTIQEVLAKH